MQRTVITGGAGFLGSHLCEYFLEQNHDVICLDNCLTGTPENISHLFDYSSFRFIEYDVTDFLFVDGPVDNILHFASPASPKDYTEYPIKTLKVGSLGTHKALGLAKNKDARFLLASTSEVYGDPEVHPQPESYVGRVNPLGPRGVYDEAKRFAEAITMAYHNTHDLDTRIARIFNTYGTRMRLNDGRALPTFIRQALRGNDVTVYGDGTQTRSFCYVDDLVEGIHHLLQKDDIYDPVNLGNPDEMQIIELARTIIETTDSDSSITFEPLPPDDPQVRQPDISRAKAQLNWEPKISLAEGLEKTIPYFKERI